MDNLKKLSLIEKQFTADLRSKINFEVLKIRYLGRKSELTSILSDIKNLSEKEKKAVGLTANKLKDRISQSLSTKNSLSLERASIDLTLPAEKKSFGYIHPIRIMQQELITIFANLGFATSLGPEIEDDYHNFGALNIDQFHPARDDQDSFYLNQNHCLRTQTSSVQFRVLESYQPPIRIVAPGKTFRRDEADATHSQMFHQIEGLIVDEQVTFADLKGTLNYFAERIFSKNIKTRFRISYFPFVEPGAEMDISCTICDGKTPNCSVCKGSGWLEILGCGMIHPRVLKNANINSLKYRGFAFGGGIERIFMIKHQISNLKIFYDNDLRFISQFKY